MTEDELIEKALAIIQRRLARGKVLSNPDDVKKFPFIKTRAEKSGSFCLHLSGQQKSSH